MSPPKHLVDVGLTYSFSTEVFIHINNDKSANSYWTESQLYLHFLLKIKHWSVYFLMRVSRDWVCCLNWETILRGSHYSMLILIC